MDDQHFDSLARALATPGSRRRAVALALGSALARLLAWEDADAHNALVACKKKSGKQKKKCLQKAKQHNAQHALEAAPPPAGMGCPTQCVDQGPASCGMTGTCANGVCQTYSSSTLCRPASCTNGILTLAAACDGAGSCPPIQRQPCPNGNCNAGGTACGPCGSDVHCGSGRWCDAGMCRPKSATGAGCSGDTQCLSGVCVSGTCCSDACSNDHGTATCADGTCSVFCDELWGNCDGNASNGCETDLNTSQHCGSCTSPCRATPCGGPLNPGFMICDGGFCLCSSA